MDNVVSLKNVKDSKKLKLVIEDLTQAIYILNLSIQSLSYFKKYVPISDSLSSLENNKTLATIHLNKLTKHLEKIKKE